MFVVVGMANHFYRERVDQHLRIGMRAIELLREQGVNQLHSRKLPSGAFKYALDGWKKCNLFLPRNG